jgi:hypothetical protein
MFVMPPNPHPGASSRRSTFKVLRVRECAPTPYPFDVFTLNSHLTLSESLGMRYCVEV